MKILFVLIIALASSSLCFAQIPLPNTPLPLPPAGAPKGTIQLLGASAIDMISKVTRHHEYVAALESLEGQNCKVVASEIFPVMALCAGAHLGIDTEYRCENQKRYSLAVIAAERCGSTAVLFNEIK